MPPQAATQFPASRPRRSLSRMFVVPKEIVISILLVETELGRNLGGRGAFNTLASMASSDLETIRPYLAPDLLTDRNENFARTRCRQKAEWAYEELKSLIRYSSERGIDPLSIPGSIYGAIGLCQFMPSQIPLYGVDADKDGLINLFSEQDALYSVANYLSAHGWQCGISTKRQHRVILAYNNSNIYASTVLAGRDVLGGLADGGGQHAVAGGVAGDLQRAEDRHAVVQQRAQHAAEAGDGQLQEDRPGQRQPQLARGRATSGRRRSAASAAATSRRRRQAASTSRPQCRSTSLVPQQPFGQHGQFAALAKPGEQLARTSARRRRPARSRRSCRPRPGRPDRPRRPMVRFFRSSWVSVNSATRASASSRNPPSPPARTMLTAISPNTCWKRAMASASVLPSSTRRWISLQDRLQARRARSASRSPPAPATAARRCAAGRPIGRR